MPYAVVQSHWSSYLKNANLTVREKARKHRAVLSYLKFLHLIQVDTLHSIS